MELRRATKKLLSDSNLRLLSNLIISLSNTTSSVQERCVEPYEDGKVYQAGVSLVLKDSELYFCKVTNQDATWTPSHWELIGKDITEIDLDTVKSWLNLSQDEIDNLQNLIDDTAITTTKTNSSSKIYMDIQAAIAECKDDTLKQIAKKVSGSYKIASSTSDVISSDYIYLISNGANYDLYVLVDSVPTKVGDTTIDLSDYAKLTDLADYLKKTDAAATYATITTVDGKVDKTSIATTLSNTSTDSQVASAKAVYDNAIKNKSLKTYTSLEQLGLTAPVTVGEIFLAIPNGGSLAVISCDDTTATVTDVPSGYGVLTIEKGEAGRFSILFKKSAGSSIAPNELYVGQLQGSDGSGLTWRKVMYGDKTTVVDKNSTNDTVPTSLAVRNAMLGMNVTNNTTYGDDILFFPCGIYKIVNNATAATLKNLPISSAGLLQVHSVNSHNSDLSTTTYVYRMYIFIPIGKRDIYIRNISTGNTAGVFTADTGWKKVCSTTVADVDKTIISTFEDPTLTGTVTYLVKNGVCYVTFSNISTSSSSTEYLVLNSNMPKSAVETRGSVFSSSDGSHKGLVIISEKTLKIRKIISDTVNLYGSFSYPVAES